MILAVFGLVVALSPPARFTPHEAVEALCGGPDALPLQVAGSRHFVDVTLTGPKGKATLRFHVDTGGNTPGVMLRRSAARRLGFESEAALPRSIQIGEHAIALPKGARWMLLDDRPDGARKNFDAGQLGAGFLSRFIVCIDPGRGRLGLGDPSRIRIEHGEASLPLILQPLGPKRALYPFLFVRVGQGGYGMLLDTGATSSMLERRPMEFLHGANPTWPLVRGAAGDADMIGGAFAERMLRADGVKATFPKAAFAELKVTGAPTIELGGALFVERPDGTWNQMFGTIRFTGGSYGAIANDVLNRFKLLIDYPAARLWLEPSGRAPDRSASMTRIGVAIEFGKDGCPIVRQTSDRNAPAVVEKLHTGDVLLEAGGADLCKLPHHQVSEALAGEPGQTKSLRIRRGADVIALQLPVADLLAPVR